MTLTDLKHKVATYQAKEDALQHQLVSMTTDAERAHLERMLRLVTVVQMGFVSNAREAIT
ncbi:hypothetical protein [Bradyrhizobium elkanii]|uniref:hypothetical protein n=1 Tax=Bradyrhizobium elkanii TaxID=29448 RepID=UPI001BA99489|nr:hypothetical protein [Bradyrhizobium elkanii]MBR1164627.1 hypothetical protein [Bradyrhizobium elkanii]